MKRYKYYSEVNYKAYQYVKRRRDIVEPNCGFVNQLREFEKNNYDFVEV